MILELKTEIQKGRGRKSSEFEASLVFTVSSKEPRLHGETLSSPRQKSKQKSEKLLSFLKTPSITKSK